MYKSGHRGINMLLFSPIFFIMIIFEYIIIGILSVIVITYFASIPDIDLKCRFLTHRGFTHTYSFGIFIGMIFSIIGLFVLMVFINMGIVAPSILTIIGVSVWGFFVGLFIVLSHVIGDIITPAGVRPFQKPRYIPNSPIFSDKKYTLDLIRASNKIANFSLLIVGTASISISFFTGIYLLYVIPI